MTIFFVKEYVFTSFLQTSALVNELINEHSLFVMYDNTFGKIMYFVQLSIALVGNTFQTSCLVTSSNNVAHEMRRTRKLLNSLIPYNNGDIRLENSVCFSYF